MAKRYNMRLVLKQRFSEFFEEKVKKESHRSLMMKMMALEVKLDLLSIITQIAEENLQLTMMNLIIVTKSLNVVFFNYILFLQIKLVSFKNEKQHSSDI